MSALQTLVKQHRIVERIAVFPRREQAQAFVDHLTRLLMSSEPQEAEAVERRVIRPERGLFLVLGIIAAIIIVAVIMVIATRS